jgi:hypothetical protein
MTAKTEFGTVAILSVSYAELRQDMSVPSVCMVCAHTLEDFLQLQIQIVTASNG